mgnify:CR=1 FL=1
MEEAGVLERLSRMEEMVYALTQIISQQTGIIDEQFQLLLNYMTVEELDRYPLLESMKSVSELRTALDL